MFRKESILDFELMDEMLKPLAKMWMPERGHGTRFESEEAFEKRRLFQFKGLLKHWFHDVEEGFGYFITHSPNSCRKKLLSLSEGDAFLDMTESLLENNLVMSTPLKLEKSDMDALYEVACSHQQDNIPLAKKLFMTLIFLDFTESRFWLGLANTHVQQDDLHGAQKIYAFSLLIGDEDPLPYLYYAKFLKMQQNPLANLAIEDGIKRASQEPRDLHLLKEFHALQESK